MFLRKNTLIKWQKQSFLYVCLAGDNVQLFTQYVKLIYSFSIYSQLVGNKQKLWHQVDAENEK